jgi:hypothetical protein
MFELEPEHCCPTNRNCCTRGSSGALAKFLDLKIACGWRAHMKILLYMEALYL